MDTCELIDLAAAEEQLVLFQQVQNFEADVENFMYDTVPALIARIRELDEILAKKDETIDVLNDAIFLGVRPSGGLTLRRPDGTLVHTEVE